MTSQRKLEKEINALDEIECNMETKKDHLRFLVNLGIPFDSEQMQQALNSYVRQQSAKEQTEWSIHLLKVKIATAEQKSQTILKPHM